MTRRLVATYLILAAVALLISDGEKRSDTEAVRPGEPADADDAQAAGSPSAAVISARLDAERCAG